MVKRDAELKLQKISQHYEEKFQQWNNRSVMIPPIVIPPQQKRQLKVKDVQKMNIDKVLETWDSKIHYSNVCTFFPYSFSIRSKCIIRLRVLHLFQILLLWIIFFYQSDISQSCGVGHCFNTASVLISLFYYDKYTWAPFDWWLNNRKLILLPTWGSVYVAAVQE